MEENLGAKRRICQVEQKKNQKTGENIFVSPCELLKSERVKKSVEISFLFCFGDFFSLFSEGQFC